jgi:hypothetical protein
MDFVERYVYLDKFTATVTSPNTFSVNLNNPGGRTPYTLIEIVSCILSNSTDVDGIVVFMDTPTPNFTSSGNTGTVLALLNVTYSQGASNIHYELQGSGTKAVLYGSVNNIKLNLRSITGADVLVDSIESFGILIKCSYPKVDEITYRSQVPLPSRV